MALAANIMKGGFSSGQAKAINGQIATGITAAGTVITDATDLVADVNAIGTCASGAGVQLANCEIGDSQIVYNGGAAQCKVYPDTSTSQINQIAVGGAHTLAQYSTCTYWKISSTRWVAVLSA